MIYDCLIIGSGLGGLSAGLHLAKNNKKVLILEKNSLPGGVVTTFKKGRFEFNMGLNDLYDFGSIEKPGKVREILKDYNIDIEADVVPFNALIKEDATNSTFVARGGIDEFFVELEKLKSGSSNSLKEFLRVIKEVNDATQKLENGEDVSEYSKFLKYIDSNVIDALTDLKMPKETINRLGFMWIYLGSPLNKLAFTDFAVFMYKLIFKKRCVLKNKNLDLVLKMVNRYQDLGGKIYYHSNVEEIVDEDIKQVKTSDGKIYKCKNVICDTSKRYVYTNLIKKENEEVKKLENARTIGPNAVIVYLGLNKDYKTLGLEYFHYYHFESLNSDNVKNMNKLYHKTFEATVLNVVNEFASPKNTTVMELKTYYFDNLWYNITPEGMVKLKEDIAEDLIRQFEESFNIDISEFIEEIEVVTPISIREFTNALDGSIMGYMRKSYDNSIHRILSFNDEHIPGIYFVGGSSIFGGCVHNAIYSGVFMARKVLESGDESEK